MCVEAGECMLRQVNVCRGRDVFREYAGVVERVSIWDELNFSDIRVSEKV